MSAVPEGEGSMVAGGLDEAITAYTRLLPGVDRRTEALSELSAYEERLLTYVKSTAETPAARVRGSWGHRALCALLLSELDQLTDYLTYRIGADGPDMAVETMQAVLKAYITGGLKLDHGRASLLAYLYKAGRSHADRLILRRGPEVLTAPDQLPYTEELQDGQPRTLDYALGTDELGRWIKQALANLSGRDLHLVYESARGGMSGRALAELTGLREDQVSSYKGFAIQRFLDQLSTMWVARTLGTTGFSASPTRETATEPERQTCQDLRDLLPDWNPRTFPPEIYSTVRRHVVVTKCAVCLSEYEAFRGSGASSIFNRFRALPLALAPTTLHRWLHSQTQGDEHLQRSIWEILTSRRRSRAGRAGTPGSAPTESTAASAGSGNAVLQQAVRTASPAAGSVSSRSWAAIRALPQRLLTSGPAYNAGVRLQMIASSTGLDSHRVGAIAVAAVMGAGVLVMTGGPETPAVAGIRPAAASPYLNITPPPQTPTPTPSSAGGSSPSPTAPAGSGPAADGGSTAVTSTPTPPQALTPTTLPTKPVRGPDPSPSAPFRLQRTTSPPPPSTHPKSPPPSPKPQNTYDTPPSLTGAGELDFTPTNFEMGDPTEHYTIDLVQRADSDCTLVPAPCWGGRWYHKEAQREEPDGVQFTVSISGGKLILDGVCPDSQHDGQHYQGTAPNDTREKSMVFNGTWSDGSDRRADIIFTITP